MAANSLNNQILSIGYVSNDTIDNVKASRRHSIDHTVLMVDNNNNNNNNASLCRSKYSNHLNPKQSFYRSNMVTQYSSASQLGVPQQQYSNQYGMDTLDPNDPRPSLTTSPLPDNVINNNRMQPNTFANKTHLNVCNNVNNAYSRRRSAISLSKFSSSLYPPNNLLPSVKGAHLHTPSTPTVSPFTSSHSLSGVTSPNGSIYSFPCAPALSNIDLENANMSQPGPLRTRRVSRSSGFYNSLNLPKPHLKIITTSAGQSSMPSMMRPIYSALPAISSDGPNSNINNLIGKVDSMVNNSCLSANTVDNSMNQFTYPQINEQVDVYNNLVSPISMEQNYRFPPVTQPQVQCIKQQQQQQQQQQQLIQSQFQQNPFLQPQIRIDYSCNNRRMSMPNAMDNRRLSGNMVASNNQVNSKSHLYSGYNRNNEMSIFKGVSVTSTVKKTIPQPQIQQKPIEIVLPKLQHEMTDMFMNVFIRYNSGKEQELSKIATTLYALSAKERKENRLLTENILNKMRSSSSLVSEFNVKHGQVSPPPTPINENLAAYSQQQRQMVKIDVTTGALQALSIYISRILHLSQLPSLILQRAATIMRRYQESIFSIPQNDEQSNQNRKSLLFGVPDTFFLFICCLQLSMKLLCDNTYTSNSWMKVSGLPIKFFIDLERKVLAELKWDI